MLTKVYNPNKQTMTEEWNHFVESIWLKGFGDKDISFEQVLKPGILNYSRPFKGRSIIDIGSGAGGIIKELAKSAEFVLGVDPSSKFIDIAMSRCRNLKNVRFEVAYIENLETNMKFDVAIANMVFQNVLDLDIAMMSIGKCLKPGGRLVFTIPNPLVWPRYWNYIDEPWFNYHSIAAIRALYTNTNLGTTGCFTTHIHRPLSIYFESVNNAGLVLQKFVEMQPLASAPADYLDTYKEPRFICIVADKQ